MAFVTIDLVLVALGLRFSGEEHSPLWIVFFVIVVAETILATRNETRLIRRGAAVSLILGTLPSPSLLGLTGFSRLYLASLITSGYVLDMLTRIAFLTAVSSVTRPSAGERRVHGPGERRPPRRDRPRRRARPPLT